jgi:hypothetical protein
VKNWLRSLLPKTQGERALKAVFDANSSATEAIHFEEIGLPNGKKTTLQWLKLATSASLRIAERENYSQESCWQSVEHDLLKFVDLMERIRDLDSTNVENFTAPIRDGIVYFIAWGDRSKVRSVTIRNPTCDSPQQRLVELIKASAVDPQNETAD